MKALNNYSDFISENVEKFHNLLTDCKANGILLPQWVLKNRRYDKENEMKKHVENFSTELFNRAGESIDIPLNILNNSNVNIETIIALFMQAFELWKMFCQEYYKTYPNDPKYFDENSVLNSFEYFCKEWKFDENS